MQRRRSTRARFSACRRRRSRTRGSLRFRPPRTPSPATGCTSCASRTRCTTSSPRANASSSPTSGRTATGDDRGHDPRRRAARQACRRVALAADAERRVRRAGARLGLRRARGRAEAARRGRARPLGARLRGRERDNPAQAGGARLLRRARLVRRAGGIGEHAHGRARPRPRLEHGHRGAARGGGVASRGDRRRRRGARLYPGVRRCRSGNARLLAPQGMAAGRERLRPRGQRHSRPRRPARRAAARAPGRRPRLPFRRPAYGARRSRPRGRVPGRRRRARGARPAGRRVVRAVDRRAGAARRDAGGRAVVEPAAAGRVERPVYASAMTLELVTAGESHGPALVAIVEGLPAGLVLDRAAIDADLRRRQQGYGRSPRQQIETDEVEVLAGLRHGRTLGTPLALVVRNRDHKNWTWGMSPWPPGGEPEGKGREPVTLPRPGHADLAGAQKYGLADVRDALERAARDKFGGDALGDFVAAWRAYLERIGWQRTR